MSVSAYFETGGVRGEICFTQPEPGANVTITVKLRGLDQYEPQTFNWNIHEFPIRYSEYIDFPCSQGITGRVFGDADLCPDVVMNVDRNCQGALGERLLSLDPTSEPQVFTDNVLNLFGPYSPIGRSIVIRDSVRGGNPLTCANIEYQGISMQTLRADFGENLQGDVIFRRQSGRAGTTLRYRLFPTCDSILVDGPTLRWYLRTGTCDNIGEVYGNNTHEDEIHHGAFSDCTFLNPRGCPAGDLTTKCGPLVISRGRYQGFCADDQLGLISLSAIQETILVIHGPGGEVIDCQPWKPIDQLCARVNCIKRPRLRIDVLFFQRDPTDRTHIRSYITGLDGEKAYLQVRRDPVTDSSECDAGGLFDKPRPALTPGAHVGTIPTGDVLPIGTLEHKIASIRDMQSLVKQNTTSWLSLFGPHSIIGRSLAIINEDGEAVACCNIEPVIDPSPELINSLLGYQQQRDRKSVV